MRRAEQGFTLIEVLVAFAIAGLALALLFRGGVAGLSTASTAARYDEATARARSHLAAACHGTRLQTGTQSGSDGGGFTWQTRVAVARQTNVLRGTEDAPQPPLLATLYAVRVTVAFPGPGEAARQVSFDTNCLVVTYAKTT
jgi:general secretion pathway protein I